MSYRNVCDAFKQLQQSAQSFIDDIGAKTTKRDSDIQLSVESINGQEFHIRIAGDLLVFVLHTNIITLPDDCEYNKNNYVADQPLRKYPGQINVYNFMADSFEFNRLNDPGYLLARLLINSENYFIVEGDRQVGFFNTSLLNFRYNHLSRGITLPFSHKQEDNTGHLHKKITTIPKSFKSCFRPF